MQKTFNYSQVKIEDTFSFSIIYLESDSKYGWHNEVENQISVLLAIIILI